MVIRNVLRTIYEQKREAAPWGDKYRPRRSRYNGAALRQIRANGQARECARRRPSRSMATFAIPTPNGKPRGNDKSLS
jgi:hypothetical protein